MITATFLAIFFIPLFYVLVVQMLGRKKTGARRNRAVRRRACLGGAADHASQTAPVSSAAALRWPSAAARWRRSTSARRRRCRPRFRGRRRRPTRRWRRTSRGRSSSPTGACGPSIEQALANNRDLRIATLNIERAQALYRIQRAELLPAGERRRERLDAAHPGQGRATTARPTPSTQYTVALGVSALGGRSLRPRPQPRGGGARAVPRHRAGGPRDAAGPRRGRGPGLPHAGGRRGQPAARRRATLEAQQASLALIQKSRDLGVASDLELSQIRSQVEAARADVARYTALVAVDLNALQVLVGAPVSPDLLPDGLVRGERRRARSRPASRPRCCSAGPTSSSAEHQLRSANANIGAARAAFFPRISLTVGVGIVERGALVAARRRERAPGASRRRSSQPLFNAGLDSGEAQGLEGGSRDRRRPLREGDPAGLRRGLERADAPADAREPAGGPGGARQVARGRPTACPTPATRPASTATSACSSRSGRSSRRSRRWSPCGSPSRPTSSRSTRCSAAASEPRGASPLPWRLNRGRLPAAVNHRDRGPV